MTAGACPTARFLGGFIPCSLPRSFWLLWAGDCIFAVGCRDHIHPPAHRNPYLSAVIFGYIHGSHMLWLYEAYLRCCIYTKLFFSSKTIILMNFFCARVAFFHLSFSFCVCLSLSLCLSFHPYFSIPEYVCTPYIYIWQARTSSVRVDACVGAYVRGGFLHRRKVSFPPRSPVGIP